ncbi:hypothetical protein [Streptomyces sp. HB132]|uniref:hypothetical protein n=1 Tax=Streptomyces sp. HB132 TaxID=767388 RepID=UPI001DA23866|nr:hypothetical protein [Streptomyces sp. HB132]MBM7439846.1 hypothetical protein [Streptomyces sp. HB132]
MSPLPGAARGNASPRGPHVTPPHQARHVLAALLLAVLALLGGAPAAAGAVLPGTPLAGLSDRSAHAADTATYAADAATYAADTATHIAGRAAHEADAATQAVPVPGPRAGADRPHPPCPCPPPGHGALPPRTQSLPPPRGVIAGPAGAGPVVVVRIRAALPGVRGPPGVKAGQSASHRSCSADLSSRPPR